MAQATTPASAVSMRYVARLDLPESVHGALRPVAVTYDRVAGETCITDARGPALQIVNEQGVPVFRTTRFAGLLSPRDACIEADGGMVLLDQLPGGGGRVVRRLDLHGEPVPFAVVPPHAGWSPSHLVVLRDGNLLTLDGDAGTLAKHDGTDGSLIWQNNVTGDESDELFLGRPCEAPDGTLYLPGGELHAVLVLDADGELVGRFGEFGTGPGKMVFPVAAAATPDGLVLVLDRMRHKIMVHDAQHRLLGEYGSIGAAPGQLYHPNDITVTDDGRVLVAQGFEGRVQVFRLAVRGRS